MGLISMVVFSRLFYCASLLVLFCAVVKVHTQQLPDLVVDGMQLKPFTQMRSFQESDCAVLEGCVASAGVRRLLRFSTATDNIGSGDLVIGSPEDDERMVYDTCHQHWHLDNFVDISLLKGQRVLRRFVAKRAHCILDTSFSNLWPSATPRGRNRKYTCSDQGLQAGWSDLYPYSMDCQWVDITSLPAGDYTLRIEVNPMPRAPLNAQRNFIEANYSNNVVLQPVTILEPAGCGAVPFGVSTDVDFKWDDPLEQSDYNEIIVGSRNGKSKSDRSVAIKLPFNFHFYCNEYSTLYANENGILALAKHMGKYTARRTASLFPSAISVLHHDWVVDGEIGKVYTHVRGKAPNQRMVVTWSQVHSNRATKGALKRADSRIQKKIKKMSRKMNKKMKRNKGPYVSFQVVLYEGTGEIEMRYLNLRTVPDKVDRGRGAMIGVAGGDANTALTYSRGLRQKSRFSLRFFHLDPNATASTNLHPVADPGGPYFAPAPGTTIQFDGTMSFDPEGEKDLEYMWTLGDETVPPDVPLPVHTYDKCGIYNISLVVVEIGGTARASPRVWTTANIECSTASTTTIDNST